MTLTYYLTVDGVDGGSNASGPAGAFVIGDFNFDVSALVSALSGGGGASGEATFSPLTVDLTLGSGLTTLLDDVASGKIIKSIELKGVTTTGQTVYDLTLSNVVITKFHDSNSSLDSLSFDYSQGAVSLTTTSFGSNGSPLSDTLSWDVANNVSLLGAPLAPPVASPVDTGGGGAQTYYLTIDGVDGGSNASGPAGAFVIGDFNFDVSALVSALSGGGGSSGKATFSPLTVDLSLASGLTRLLDDVASGKFIKSIELQGVTSTGGTVYDLTLNNVVITKFHDSNSGLDSLSFDYSQGAVSLTTRPIESDGSLGGPDTQSWDVANNVNLLGAPLAPPVAAPFDTGGGGAQTYYLTIDGVDGGSAVTGHAGAFVIGDYSFDVSGLVSALSGGGGSSGKATFSPLTVDLSLGSGLTRLLGDVASGELIRSIELQGVTSGAHPETVYDLTLSNVFITRVHDSNSGLDSLSFDYSQGAVSLTTRPIKSDGSLGGPDTQSWDVANNVNLLGAPLAPPVAGSVDTGGGGAQTYYLTIDGVDGGSAVTGHAGAFVIGDYSFDVSGLVSALSGGGGSSGKATFSPLTVDLTLGSGLTRLLGDVASGELIRSIELQGVTSGAHPETVYDLTLSNVFITRVHDSNSGLDSLSFDYSQGAVSLTTRPIKSDGSLGGPDTQSWDVANNVNLLGAPLAPPVAGSVDTGGGGAQTYYLTIDGVDGGSAVTGHAGAFVIGDYSFDVSGLVSALSGGGGSSGKATFSPLTVDLTLGSGLTRLLGDVASGELIRSIELQGVTSGAHPETVYDLTLSNVFITRVHDSNSGLDRLSFDYSHGTVSLTTTPIGSTGAPGAPDTMSWDVANNRRLVTAGPSVTDTTTAGETVAHGTTVAVGTVTPGSPGDTLTLTQLSGPPGAVTLSNGIVSFAVPANATGAPLPSPVAGSVDTGGGGAQTYYLTIDGVDGGSTVSGHAGAFVIGDFSFDVSALVSALSGGGGASGKATFSPLTVDLSLSSGLTTLLGDVASGKIIKSIELKGVTTSGQTVYDLTLSNVFITQVHDSNSGLDSLSFDYSHGAVSLTTTPIGPGGAPGTPDTLSWDVANNVSLLGATLAPPVASLADTGGGGAQTYYLTIDGVDGGSTVSGHAGAFVIGDFGFDVSALVSALSGGGGASGKATFSPLTVDLTLGSGLTTLLGDVASGKIIKSIELQGVSSTGQTVYDLTLSNVFITRVHDSSGLDSLSFDYSHGAVSLTTTPIGPGGTPGTPDTMSWDVANNVGLLGATLAPPVAGSVDTGGGGAQTYYLTIDGVDGGSTASGHAGAFVIGDFGFDVSALVSALSGGGGASGKATFSPLTVDLTLGSGLTTLLGDVASGKIIKSIEIQGVTSGAHPQTVYDLTLSNVFITRVHDGNSGLDSLSFDYSHGAVSLTTTSFGSTGAPQSDTLSWDVANNISLLGATLAPPVAGSVDTGGGGAQTYYLTIDGVDGGSTASGHAGAFVIDDFNFDVSALVTALSGGGGASGTTTFSPLTVDLSLGSGLTTLLGDVASGKIIKSIELKGVTTTGQTVYDLTLSNVFITQVRDSSGLDSLSFDYSHGAVSLTTTPIGPGGAPGTPDTLSWDVANNVSLLGATLAPPVASLADTGGGGAQTYYLTIDGVDGGSTVSGHAGAFVIGDFGFDVSALVSALSGGGGASGKATFSPLTVDLTLGSGLTTLLGDVASGKIIKSIELKGVTTTGQTVYDLTLSNVFITRVHDSSGLDSLSFDYSHGAVSLTTTSFGSNGAPQSDTLSWDVANNVSLLGATLAPPVAGSVDTGGGGAQTYYLTVDGVDGGSTVSGHAGAFVIGDFSFDVSALVSALSGGGGASGKATFSPLTVDLTLGSGLTTLLGDVASGKIIKSIELKGVTTTGQTVYDLTLSNVFITQVRDSSGLDRLSFDYSHGAVSLTTRPIKSDGSPGAPVTLSWDVANNKQLANLSGNVAFSYQISDQLGNVSGVISDTLTIDPGPSVTDTTTVGETVAHGTTVAVGTVTLGLPGDTLTLTELSGPPGAVTLANGVVSFAAPANASGNVAFSYQISDQVGDVSAVVSDTLAVDPGPSITDTTSVGEKVAHGTTVAVGIVTPGLPGDTLTLTELTGPAGAVTLANGVVSFATLANASGNVAFSYQISDQLGDVSAVISDTLAVDPGPKAGSAHLYASPGQSVDLTSVLLALDTPGLPGDTLTLSGIGTAGTLGTVSLSNGDLVYTAPTTGSSIGGGSITSDAFIYTVSDQLHESATASVNVSLLNKNGSTALTGSGNIVITTDGNRTVTSGSGSNFVSLGGGNDSVSLGGDNNTVVLGDGNDSVSLSGKNNMVRLGNGNDSVTAGDGSMITLGDGNDLVYAGANSTVVVGNGNNTVFAGANDVITIGTGHDVIAFGMNGSPTIGNEVVTGFRKGDTLEFNRQLLGSFATAMLDARQMGADTVITIDPHDSVTLRGVAMTSLTTNSFKFG